MAPEDKSSKKLGALEYVSKKPKFLENFGLALGNKPQRDDRPPLPVRPENDVSDDDDDTDDVFAEAQVVIPDNIKLTPEERFSLNQGRGTSKGKHTPSTSDPPPPPVSVKPRLEQTEPKEPERDTPAIPGAGKPTKRKRQEQNKPGKGEVVTRRDLDAGSVGKSGVKGPKRKKNGRAVGLSFAEDV